jgi:phosphomannomutase
VNPSCVSLNAFALLDRKSADSVEMTGVTLPLGCATTTISGVRYQRETSWQRALCKFVGALQMLAVVKQHDQPASITCRRFEPVTQITKNVRCRDGRESVTEHAVVIDAIFNAKERLRGRGRLIVRPSGTDPLIRVTGEGDNPDLVESGVDSIVEALNGAMPI